ncbi:MAG: chorismate mutase [archaeon]|nr:chorismate mutase [archaeon]
MSRTIRLGYMGIPFSNSEAMAIDFARQMNWKNLEYVPLMSSRNTIDALLRGEIDYGVIAVRNSSAGVVAETEKALEGTHVRKVLEGSERIHHCMFTLNDKVEVRQICSHIQALGQCKANLAEMYPDAKQFDCSDTAYAAEMLSKGELPEDCGVLCRKAAGENYGLHLKHENIEDRGDNETFFYLIRL